MLHFLKRSKEDMQTIPWWPLFPVTLPTCVQLGTKGIVDISPSSLHLMAVFSQTRIDR